MKKMTFIGIEAEKDGFLQRLQNLGITHLIHPSEPTGPSELIKELQRVVETKKFLAKKGPKGKPEEDRDYKTICQDREELGKKEAKLQADIVAFKKQRTFVEPWGDFSLADVETLRQSGLSIQLFRVSRKIFESLPLDDTYNQIVNEKGGDICFALFSPEPIQLDITEEKLPSRRLSDIDREIAYNQAKLDEVKKEYTALAEYQEVLEKAEIELTNVLEYQTAILNTRPELDDRLFILQAWTPADENELISKIGPDFTLYHYSEEPQEEEKVPVLLKNSAAFNSGEDLVNVYSFPNYNDFDPTPYVLWCFAVFFGMIIGDLGYGLILLGLTVYLHRKIQSDSPFAVRFFRLMYIVSISTVIFGVLGAGVFGIVLSDDNFLKKHALLDFSTTAGQTQVMIVSIVIGMIHICLAMAIKFVMSRSLAWLGWILAIWSAFFFLNSRMAHGVDNQPAMYGMIIGLVVVFLFSSTSKNLLVRFAEGLLGLLDVIQVFSDVLSYLRLFALGIATVYIAQTFNILGQAIIDGLPVIGYLFAALVLIFGHTLNICLAIMGGVIHGLRLNFLEWYRWCFEGDGLPYKPFQRINE